jgi:hypothetical protein
MNAVAPHSMFQSAYAQISTAERRFVDRLVDAFAEAARIKGCSIRLALQHPLPAKMREQDHQRWLDRPLVQAAVTERVHHRADANEITVEGWLKEVVAIAQFDLTDYFLIDEFGDPAFDIERLRDAERSGAIKSIEVERSDSTRLNMKVKVKVQAHDKIAALKMWQSYLGLDNEDNPQRRADKAAQEVPTITAGTSTTQAGETYARLIGDNE